MPLPDRPGTYALLLASATEREINVGSLGCLQVVPGCYVYVGSAHGPGGLAARVSRHQLAAKTLRWHVDYLRAATELVAVWYTLDENRRECRWADVMSRLQGAKVPMSGFGASDCDCRSHLFHFAPPPAFREFRQRVRATIADHATVRCVTYTQR
jgi:Uri superfamily endonuclease